MLDDRRGCALPRPVPRRHGASGVESSGFERRSLDRGGPGADRIVPADGRAFRGALASRWPSAPNNSAAPFPPTQMMNRSLLAAAILALAACQSTSVQTYSSPGEATRAIVAAAEIGDAEEASRIFDTFARSSVQRDRVLVELVDAGLGRLEAGRHRAAAGVLSFACERYPGAVGARDSLVLALLLERGTADSAGPGQTAALEEAVADARTVGPSPAIWVDLAAAQVAVDAGDQGRAQESFAAFLGAWTGQPASLTSQVEELRRRLGAE